MILFLVCLIILLGLFGAPLFAVLGALALLGFYTQGTDFAVVGIEFYKMTQQHILITIPLFTFAGYLMAEARTADRLVKVAQAALGWVPGGLAVVALLTCAFFGTFTGVSGVAIIAIGGLLYPILIKELYPESFSLGLLTSSAKIGLLFPPSIPLILYGIVYALSMQSTPEAMARGTFDIGTFFLAGLVPGLFLLLVVGGYCMFVGQRANVPRLPFHGKEVLRALWDAKWEVPIPFVLLGLIYGGIITIGEAAAVTALYVLVIEVWVYRDLKFFRDVPRIVRESTVLVGAIFLILAVSLSLTAFFVEAEVPQKIFELMKDYIHSPLTFLLVLNVFLLIVGAIMDIFSAIVVVLPLVAVVASQFGINPYHLGIIFLVNLEIGYLTPPVGINLFIASFRFGKPLVTLYWAVLPFIALLIICLLVITYVPALTVGSLEFILDLLGREVRQPLSL
ncbi:MAG TPA: TRAP transporter large permease [Nitrospirales bacterium]|nr:TRAP transporter large permease [Nitrospirales bacterium]